MDEINNVNKIDEVLSKKNKLVLCIYDENCIVSNMFLSLMKKIEFCEIKNALVYMIKKTIFEEYNFKKNMITPKIIVYEEGIIVSEIDGFMNYNCLNNELKKYELC